ATYANGVFTVASTGKGFFDCAVSPCKDDFHFVYQGLSGDGSIVARVLSAASSNNYATAGVMIRQTLDPNSPNVNMYFKPFSGNAIATQSARTVQGGSSSGNNSNLAITFPYWLKVVRTQDTFTAYISSEGANWTQVGVYEWIGMPQNLYVGLGVSNYASS